MKLRKSSFTRLQLQAAFQNQQMQFYQSNSNLDYSNSSSSFWNPYSSPTAISPNKEIPWGGDKMLRWANNKTLTAVASRQLRPSGKGRFGKRPASFPIDYGHSNDNSNDSGLECENSNSDSQFWGSTEDLRSIGLRATTVINGNQSRRVAVSQMQSSSGDDLSSVDLRKTQTVYIPNSSVVSSTIVDPIFDEKKMCSGVTTSTEVKSMSPDSTVVENGVSVGGVPTLQLMDPTPLSLGNDGSSKTYFPVKRSRFSFQTPAVPMRSPSALKLRNQNQANGSSVRSSLGKRLPPGTPPTLSSAIATTSYDGRVQLQIMAQPEEQHRARYQTEGSRGAIKDRKGNGFPAVKLVGYDKPATLQIFIGSDQGKVSPHMFYQACKVTGKSSTPCLEKKVEGTIVIEIEFEPSKEMVISCDCVGILKERNVDVEQRFPFHHAASSRKKSTRCRLIFRTTIMNSEGVQETLQISSLPILCTQPPGQPEISKKSLSECFSRGGQELFIVGKNFLKDTKVIVQEETSQGELLWEVKAEILKDYLQQNHLICVLPAYKDENIMKPVDCKVAVWSGGKLSEPHHLTYLPNNQNVIYGVQAISCVPTVDTHIQSQSLNQNTIQQQLTQSMLSVDMPMGGGSIMPSGDSLGTNSFIREPGTIEQISELVQSPIPTATLVLNFENTMLAPTTTPQQERQVVSELQEILDHSSQQTMMSITDTKPNPLSLGPTSFFGMNFTAPLPMDVSPSTSFQQSNIVTQASTQESNTSNVVIYSDLTDQQVQDLSHNRPNLTNLSQFDSTASCITVMPQMMSVVQPLSAQILCNGTSQGDTVINCMNQVMKSEQSSPGIDTSCAQSPANPQMMNVMNLMGGELHGDQGSIANALTQLSDNELLNYINPSCFEQDIK